MKTTTNLGCVGESLRTMIFVQTLDFIDDLVHSSKISGPGKATSHTPLLL